MNSPITPLQSPQGPHRLAVAADSAARDAPAFALELASSEGAGAIEVMRAEPPAEVFSQIAAAGRMHDRLQQEGRELRFSLDGPDASLQIEMHDLESGGATTVSSAEAIDIAAGRPLEH